MRSALTSGGDDSALSYCGKGNTESTHLKSCNANQDVPHKVLYDAPVVEYCGHSHSGHRNLDRYNCPSLIHHSQKLGIQDSDNSFAWRVSVRLSNLDERGQIHAGDSYVRQRQTPQYFSLLAACLFCDLLEPPLSWLWFQVSKVYRMLSASLCGKLKSLTLHLAAKQDCQSYFWQLNQVAYPYFNITINGGRM